VFRAATHVWQSCGVLVAALMMASPAAAQTPARSPHPCLIWTTCTPQIGPWVVSTGRGHDGYTLGCPDDPNRPGVPQRAVGSDVVFAAEGEPPGSILLAGYLTNVAGLGGPGLGFGLWRGREGMTYQPAIGCAPRGAASKPLGQAAAVARSYRARVRSARIRPGAVTRVRVGCAGGERLVHSRSAVAFFTRRPPSRQVIKALEHHRRRPDRSRRPPSPRRPASETTSASSSRSRRTARVPRCPGRSRSRARSPAPSSPPVRRW
jgi:hypothetical protein